MSTSRIAELAALIQQNTSIVDKYLRDSDLPSPSFDENGPADFSNILDPAVAQARHAVVEATTELRDLMMGPSESLRSALAGVNGSSIHAIGHYEIASKVPINGEISYAQLASKCGLTEPTLKRFLRFAMVSHRVFKEPRIGFVAHTAASRRILEDHYLSAGLGFEFDECWQALAHAVPAMEKFKQSDEPNETGWCLGQDTNVPLWEFYQSHPKKAARFATAMEGFNNLLDTPQKVLVNGYPWQTIGDNGTGTIVDVGGSKGNISVAIAKSYPNLKFVVQDLPEPIEGAKEAIPTELSDRIDFMVHDFFKEQPVQGDAYSFRYIFHNWADSKVLKILRALVPALRPGAKVIVNDFMIPEPGTMSSLHERAVRNMDLVMFSLYNAREREKGDWEMLFREADPRFTNIKVWIPVGATMALIEATWL